MSIRNHKRTPLEPIWFGIEIQNKKTLRILPFTVTRTTQNHWNGTMPEHNIALLHLRITASDRLSTAHPIAVYTSKYEYYSQNTKHLIWLIKLLSQSHSSSTTLTRHIGMAKVRRTTLSDCLPIVWFYYSQTSHLVLNNIICLYCLIGCYKLNCYD